MFNLNDYFEEALALLDRESLCYRDRLDLGGHIVDLATHSPILRAQFLPALTHLASESESDADLTILYADSSGTTSPLKAPPMDLFNGQGYAATIDQHDVQIFYQPWLRQVFLYSRLRRIGLYWVINPEEVPWWEMTFSFRIIFHWWSRDQDLQLMHAGAISEDGKHGWLIPGPSGSGKSTSCLQLLLSGRYYLGDDYVVLRTKPPFKVHSLYQSAKINHDNFDERFTDLHSQLRNPQSYRDQKAILHIGEHYPDRLLKSADLVGILVPRIASPSVAQSTASAVSAAKALMSIAPTTLRHLPHHRAEAFSKISTVVNAAPCYQWLLGSDKHLLTESFGRVTSDEGRKNA